MVIISEGQLSYTHRIVLGAPIVGGHNRKSGGGAQTKIFSEASRRNLCFLTFKFVPAPLSATVVAAA